MFHCICPSELNLFQQHAPVCVFGGLGPADGGSKFSSLLPGLTLAPPVQDRMLPQVQIKNKRTPALDIPPRRSPCLLPVAHVCSHHFTFSSHCEKGKIKCVKILPSPANHRVSVSGHILSLPQRLPLPCCCWTIQPGWDQ